MSARVNLLPREIEERARARKTTSWVIGGVAAYAALLGLLYIAKLGDLNAARAERDQAQTTVVELQQELATLEQYAELDRQVTARNRLLAAAMAEEISWARVFNDLALTFPASSSMLSMQAAAVGADETTVAPDPAGDAVASFTFQGYSVERFAPGVERVLVRFDEVETFFNTYLSEAGEEERGDTEVTAFGGTVQLNDEAYTRRYVDGLPPEAGR